MARKKKNENYEMGTEEKKGGGLKTVLITLGIILFIVIILILLIKLNVGGFGRNILRPLLKDVPVVNKILPAADNEELERESGMNLEQALAKIEALEKENETLKANQTKQTSNSDKGSSAKVKELEKEVNRLKAFEDNQSEFEKTKEEFYNQVVYNDKAPDPSTYTQWYEKMDADSAAKIYKEVVGNVQKDESIKELADTYAAMKPEQAAGVLQNMSGDLDMVAQILSAVPAKNRSDILGAMDSAFAAKITKKLMP